MISYAKGQTLTPTRKPRKVVRPQKGTPYAGNATPSLIRPPAPRPVAPKPPAPRKPQGMPYDPAYQMQMAQLGRQQGLTQSGLQFQTNQTKQEFGFDDPSNPFSRANMLQRAWSQGQAGRLNTAGNNLYSSSFQRNEDFARFGHEQDVDTSRRDYAKALQSLQQQGAQATLDYQGGAAAAHLDRIERAARAEDPGGPAVAPPVSRKGPAKVAGKKVKGKKGTPIKSTRKVRRVKRNPKAKQVRI